MNKSAMLQMVMLSSVTIILSGCDTKYDTCTAYAFEQCKIQPMDARTGLPKPLVIGVDEVCEKEKLAYCDAHKDELLKKP